MNQHINELDNPEVRKLRASLATEQAVHRLLFHRRPRWGWQMGQRRPIPTSGPKLIAGGVK